MTGLLLLALLLGGLIGWERERHERPAGLRTHILVCIGSALITLVSNSESSNGGRIAAQIVSGVGFLGAGTIIRDASGPVRGLTTAASLWTIAGVGIAVGYGGMYAGLAAIATVVVLFTLTLLNKFEDDIIRQRRRHELKVVFKADAAPLEAIGTLLDTLHHRGAKTRDLKLEQMADAELASIQVTLGRSIKRDDIDEALCHVSEILHFQWSE